MQRSLGIATIQSPINPWRYTDGNSSAEILIISEYFSAEEQQKAKPLVGSAGWEFRKMCDEAGISWNNTLRTVIAPIRPYKAEVANLFQPTKTVDKKTTSPFRGCYPVRDIIEAKTRISALIKEMPNLKLIIGLGNLPLWLCTDKAVVGNTAGVKLPSGAMKWRGSQIFTEDNIPYLPLVSPNIVLKDWSYRFYTVHDLRKRAAAFINGKLSWFRQPPITFPKPSYNDVMILLEQWETQVKEKEFDLAVDIETWRRTYIATLGLADATCSICIPFFYLDENFNLIDYFTEEQEFNIWTAVRRLLNHPNTKIIGQNYSYDIQFPARSYGITSRLGFDTMLAHHLIWPGTPKSLDFLASVYCDHYVYWKDESQDWEGAFNHESLWTYNCKDTRETYDLKVHLAKMIEDKKLNDLWQDRLDQWHMAMDMMLRGINVNKKHFQVINAELRTIAEELENELLEMVPDDLKFTAAGGPWFNSPALQMTIFYHVLGLSPVLHKKTKRPTLDASAIPILRDRNPWLAPLFSKLEVLRSISVFRSHFLEMRLSFDGRLRTNFNIAGTETFRWSSSANGFGEGTNFQNIPKGDD